MRIKVDEDLPRAAVRTMSLNRLRGQRLWSPPWHSCSSCSKLKSGDPALARLGRILIEDHYGKAVLYTSDLTAYSNMYLVTVGEFD